MIYPTALLENIDLNNLAWLRSWGCTVVQLAQATIAINPRYPSYNGIFAIDCLDEKEAAGLISHLSEKMRKESGQSPSVWLDKYCQPEGLPQVLEGLGFRYASASYTLHIEPKLVRKNPAPTLLPIKQVKKPEDLEAWIDVYSQAFDRQNEREYECARWREAAHKQDRLCFYIGRYNSVHGMSDEPAAVGQLITNHDIGGVYSIGTKPEFRRRGFASAMISRIAREAVGFRLADIYLIVRNEPNKRFFENLGFSEVLQTQTWNRS